MPSKLLRREGLDLHDLRRTAARRFMNMKLIVAILVTTAMPVYAQAQDRNPVVTAAQKVVEIISSDPAKVETYCAIGNAG